MDLLGPLTAKMPYEDETREDKLDEETAQKVGKTANSLVAAIPPLNRQLMLYILDLISVFSSHSRKNRMTKKRIVAAFQPSLLSGPPGTMETEDYELAAQIVILLTCLYSEELLVYV